MQRDSAANHRELDTTHSKKSGRASIHYLSPPPVYLYIPNTDQGRLLVNAGCGFPKAGMMHPITSALFLPLLETLEKG